MAQRLSFIAINPKTPPFRSSPNPHFLVGLSRVGRCLPPQVPTRTATRKHYKLREILRRLSRNLNTETCMAVFRLNSDGAVMGIDDLPDDIKPQSEAPLVGGKEIGR